MESFELLVELREDRLVRHLACLAVSPRDRRQTRAACSGVRSSAAMKRSEAFCARILRAGRERRRRRPRNRERPHRSAREHRGRGPSDRSGPSGADGIRLVGSAALEAPRDRRERGRPVVGMNPGRPAVPELAEVASAREAAPGGVDVLAPAVEVDGPEKNPALIDHRGRRNRGLADPPATTWGRAARRCSSASCSRARAQRGKCRSAIIAPSQDRRVDHRPGRRREFRAGDREEDARATRPGPTRDSRGASRMVGPDAPCAAGRRIAVRTNSAASQPVSSRIRSCTSRRAAGPAEHPGSRMPSVETIRGTSPAGVIPKPKMSSGSGRVARERVGNEASAAVLGSSLGPQAPHRASRLPVAGPPPADFSGRGTRTASQALESIFLSRR